MEMGSWDFSGSFEFLVPAAQVTAVVIGDAIDALALGFQLARGKQMGDELGVVNDLVVAAEMGIVVAQRVQAVRARGDDLFCTGLVEHLDIGLGLHLEQ